MRSAASTLSAAVALAVLFANPSRVRADTDEASTLLRQAVELRRAHRNQEALDVYAKAFALAPTPAVRAQLALAEQSLAHWIEAERDLDGSLATEDRWVEKNRATLQEALEVVRQHLAWLTVDVDAPEAVVQLDGQPIPQGVEARVVAGSGVLEAHAPARVPDIRRLSLSPGEHVHARITLAALVAAPSPARPSLEPAVSVPLPVSPPPPAKPPSVPVGPIVVGVAGLVGIGVGAYYGVRVFQDTSDERLQCSGAKLCKQAAGSDYSDAQTSATASDVAFGAGLALVAGGAVWWLLSRGNSHSGSLRVVPGVGAGMTGLVVLGDL